MSPICFYTLGGGQNYKQLEHQKKNFRVIFIKKHSKFAPIFLQFRANFIVLMIFALSRDFNPDHYLRNLLPQRVVCLSVSSLVVEINARLCFFHKTLSFFPLQPQREPHREPQREPQSSQQNFFLSSLYFFPSSFSQLPQRQKFHIHQLKFISQHLSTTYNSKVVQYTPAE